MPITPCRIADTRPNPTFNVGPRNTPIGAKQTHTIGIDDPDTECPNGTIPAEATGLQTNVTALGATAGSFLTIWGSGTRPNAASLNPAPGQPPIPNAVTTGLTGTNTFNVYNEAGTVHVVIDIVGYYIDHHHDDRYYTEDEVDTLIAKATAPQKVTEYVSVPAAAFQARYSASDVVPYPVNKTAGRTFSNTAVSDSTLLAPVNLPHGAEVASVTFGLFDNGSRSLTGYLVRSDNTFMGWDAMAETDVSTNSTSIEFYGDADGTIDNPTIDNTAYTYWVEVSAGSWAGTGDAESHAVSSVTIRYTIQR